MSTYPRYPLLAVWEPIVAFAIMQSRPTRIVPNENNIQKKISIALLSFSCPLVSDTCTQSPFRSSSNRFPNAQCLLIESNQSEHVERLAVLSCIFDHVAGVFPRWPLAHTALIDRELSLWSPQFTYVEDCFASFCRPDNRKRRCHAQVHLQILRWSWRLVSYALFHIWCRLRFRAW